MGRYDKNKFIPRLPPSIRVFRASAKWFLSADMFGAEAQLVQPKRMAQWYAFALFASISAGWKYFRCVV